MKESEGAVPAQPTPAQNAMKQSAKTAAENGALDTAPKPPSARPGDAGVAETNRQSSPQSKSGEKAERDKT